jgi:tRNA uridine 5-carboxymethylaminomethyl modification enzyme
MDQLQEALPELAELPPDVAGQLSIDALYANYVARQQLDAASLKRDEGWEIPEGFDYSALNGLSNELKAKLERARPHTLGQAGRVDGVTPAALTLLLAKLRQAKRERTA